MNNEKRDPQDMLPLEPTSYHILLALAGQPRHGYAIMKCVEEDIGKDVPSPKIYRYLRKMSDEGLIEIDEKRTAQADDPRRRYYKLTGFGATVYRDETRRLASIVKTAQGLLGGLQLIAAIGDV